MPAAESRRHFFVSFLPLICADDADQEGAATKITARSSNSVMGYLAIAKKCQPAPSP
jgi:hypothetical protein